MMWPVSAQLTGTDPNMDNILKANSKQYATQLKRFVQQRQGCEITFNV